MAGIPRGVGQHRLAKDADRPRPESTTAKAETDADWRLEERPDGWTDLLIS